MLKKFLILFPILIISVIPLALAQEISLGTPADQEIKILVQPPNSHVIHKIKSSNTIQEVIPILENFSNLKVTNINGEEVQFGTVHAKNVVFSIFPTNQEVIVEYDIDNIIEMKNGVWTWDFAYPQTTKFIFPQEIDLIFINGIAVNIEKTDGINCHGCNAVLEFIENEPVIFKKIIWENEEFDLKVRTLTEINSLNFDQTSKSISFDVSEKDQFITFMIPLKLLWNPYEVFLNDEKIFKQEFFMNETHVWLNLRPNETGTISIIGTSAIPEFPIFSPLVFGLAILITLGIRKFNLH